MISSYSNSGGSESKIIFKWRKQNNTTKTKTNKKALQGANVRTYCISFSQSELPQKSPPWACDKGCAEACAGRFSAMKLQADQSWPTLTSCSLQSIARPFRFRAVFGNARILIFYLSINAWEEKSLPKSYLGRFFLVFREGKATIFWFIWPLNSPSRHSHNIVSCITQYAL